MPLPLSPPQPGPDRFFGVIIPVVKTNSLRFLHAYNGRYSSFAVSSVSLIICAFVSGIAFSLFVASFLLTGIFRLYLWIPALCHLVSYPTHHYSES